MRSRYRQRFSTSRARSASTLLALRRTMKIPTRPRRRFSRLGQPHVFAIRPLPRAFLLSSNQYCEASCTGQVRRWSRFQMRRRERRGVKTPGGWKKAGLLRPKERATRGADCIRLFDNFRQPSLILSLPSSLPSTALSSSTNGGEFALLRDT